MNKDIIMELPVSHVEYMKVIDIMAGTLKADKDVEILNPGNEIHVFQVNMTGIDGKMKTCRLNLHEYSVDFIFSKDMFEDREYEKFLSAFEYELEQAFLKNIKFEHDEDVSNHKLKIAF